MDLRTIETLPTTGLTWEAVCRHPSLRDLPFKIELNQHGQILMSPTRIDHSRYQSRLARLLWTQLPGDGEVLTECAIRTEQGTRVADVAYVSAGRLRRIAGTAEAEVAPELCVEILSPGNTEEEMAQQRRLYLAAGAQEVWICDLEGQLFFFDATGRRPASTLVPGAPVRIDL
ncbi:MAG: Uma2 family endonuclease [Bacteroidota bacterium]